MLTLLQPIIVRLGVIHISYEHLLSMLLFGGVRSWLRNKNDERVQQALIGSQVSVDQAYTITEIGYQRNQLD